VDAPDLVCPGGDQDEVSVRVLGHVLLEGSGFSDVLSWKVVEERKVGSREMTDESGPFLSFFLVVLHPGVILLVVFVVYIGH
jgi:hypothetical protein